MKENLFVCDYCGEMWTSLTNQMKHSCKILRDEPRIAFTNKALKPPKDTSIINLSAQRFILPDESIS